MAKQVRTIAEKLNDIAEAAADPALAGRRITRLQGQLERLALLAIQGQYMLSSARMTEIVSSPERDEILAEAVVGNWNAVGDLINTAFFNASHAIPAPVNALADPLTGQTVTLEPRQAPGTTSPLHFPCCGGLRPAHTSHCRAQ